MKNGIVMAICICPELGKPMQEVESVEAIAGMGLKGDRYATGEGSWNKGRQGKRQVTLFNWRFIHGSNFSHVDTRRNIFVDDAELMYLIGKRFPIGGAIFDGIKYCDPCPRPSNLSGNSQDFQETFFDRGGLIAQVAYGGIIRVGDPLLVPPRE